MRRCRCFILMLLVEAAASAAPKPAGNPHMRKAQQLFNDLEFEKALVTLQKASEWPKNTPQDVVWIALMQGITLGELSRPDEALAAFAKALEVDPNAPLPIVTSPKIVALYEQARRTDQARRAPPPPPTPVVVAPPAVVAPAAGEPGMLRSKAWIPAAAGGALFVGGLLSLGGARGAADQLTRFDPAIATVEQRKAVVQTGKNLQVAGCVLVGVGTAALGAAAGMLFLNDLPGQTAVSVAPTDEGAFATVLWRM